MFDIDINGKITITKGDNGHAELMLNSGTFEQPVIYTLLTTDTVHLYVYPKACKWETDSFIHKTFTKADLNLDNLINIPFAPEDTSTIKPDKYAYRIRLVKSNGEVNTVVEENTFEILK